MKPMVRRWRWLPLIPLVLFATAAVVTAGDEDAKKTAKEWIEKAAEAYRVPAGFEDDVEFKVEFGTEEPHVGAVKVHIGRPGEARIEMPQAPLLVVVGGHAYFSLPESDEKKAMKVAIDKDPLKTLESAFDGMFQVAPQLALRWGASGESALRAITWDTLNQPNVERVELLKDAKPPVRRLHLTGTAAFFDGSATATVDFDAKTSLLVATSMTADSEHGEIKFSYRNKPKALDVAPKITFDTTGYEFVDSPEELFGMGDMADYAPKVAAGEVAPAFSLVDQAGKTHSLKALEGKFVLLDWWGIW